MNLGPSIAYKVNDWFSLGVGADAQYAELELYQVANLGTGDVEVKNKASSWGYGWHAGAMLEAPTGTRLGLNFRSEISHNFEGKSRESGRSNTVKGSTDFPWLLDLSAYHQINQKFSALATISYVHWSSMKKIELRGVLLPGVDAPQTSIDELNYKDTWTFLAGLRYQFTDSIMFKVGGGYDQTPTNNTDRNVRLPDENRWIASVGVRWVPRAAKFATIDIGYAHLFPENASINKDLTTASGTNTSNGTVKGNADLFGLQVSLKAGPMVNAMLGRNGEM
jgi:long-chain fatty acid transport protein